MQHIFCKFKARISARAQNDLIETQISIYSPLLFTKADKKAQKRTLDQRPIYQSTTKHHLPTTPNLQGKKNMNIKVSGKANFLKVYHHIHMNVSPNFTKITHLGRTARGYFTKTRTILKSICFTALILGIIQQVA